MADPTVSSLSRFGQNGSEFIMNTANMQNPRLVAEAIASGHLSPDALNGVPNTEVIRAGTRVRQGSTPLGNGARTSKRFTVNPGVRRFVANPRFGPQASAEARLNGISGDMELVEGVPLGTFMGGTARRVDISQTPSKDFDILIRHLTVQAEVLKAARSRPEFNRNRITVEEGVYMYQDTELENEGDLASLAAKGRAIGYVVKDFQTGATNKEQTFALAEYFSSHPWHDKIILDYHSFAQGLDMGMRAFVVLPELDETFSGNWGRTEETRYNGVVQSQSLVLLS
jgi:hypothetical protein